MLLTRWANIALATNFDSSELLGADNMGTGEPLRGKIFQSPWELLNAPAKTPQVGGQDSIPWDPVGIDIGQHLNCILAAELWAVSTPDPDFGVQTFSQRVTCQNPYSQNVLLIESLKLFVVVRLLPK